MHTEDIGERLLAEAERPPVGLKVASDRSLQIALHDRNRGNLLLDGLQTHE